MTPAWFLFGLLALWCLLFAVAAAVNPWRFRWRWALVPYIAGAFWLFTNTASIAVMVAVVPLGLILLLVGLLGWRRSRVLLLYFIQGRGQGVGRVEAIGGRRVDLLGVGRGKDV